MAYEHKIFLTLEDIQSICLQCKKCGAKIGVSPDSALPAPARCFQCQAEWIKASPQIQASLGQLMPEPQTPVVNLMKALASLRSPEGANTLGFRILLEFDAAKF